MEWSGPLFATWLVTANNAVIDGDMHRRVCHIRLEADVEKPAERTFDRDLVAYVQANRQALTRAALTVLRAYCAAGKPSQSLKPWGSFEGWSALVRGAIVWAGWPDPIETQRELSRTNGERADLERALVESWQFYGNGKPDGITVKQFFALVDRAIADDEQTARDADVEPERIALLDTRATRTRATLESLGVPMGVGEKGRSQKLGMVLNEVRNRVYSVAGKQCRIEVGGAGHAGVNRWLVLSSSPRVVVGGGTSVSFAGGQKDESQSGPGGESTSSAPSGMQGSPTTHHHPRVEDAKEWERGNARWDAEADPRDHTPVSDAGGFANGKVVPITVKRAS